jgi:hypothetical protein
VTECKGAKTDPICAADAGVACTTLNISLANTCLDKLAKMLAQPCDAPSVLIPECNTACM